MRLRSLMPAIFQIVGFMLVVIGIGLVSVPAACVAGGVILFVAGGFEAQAQMRHAERHRG